MMIHTETPKDLPVSWLKLILKFIFRTNFLFSVINYSQKYDVKHIPKQLFNDYYNYPMEIDPMGKIQQDDCF